MGAQTGRSPTFPQKLKLSSTACPDIPGCGTITFIDRTDLFWEDVCRSTFTPLRTRTSDLLLRRQLLYPTELTMHKNGRRLRSTYRSPAPPFRTFFYRGTKRFLTKQNHSFYICPKQLFALKSNISSFDIRLSNGNLVPLGFEPRTP